MFYDYVKIYVKGGNGGNGMVAFRREKFVPYGGPAGGDGGRGANVVFVGDESLNTLIDFKYKQHYKAPNGVNGQSKSMHGKAGCDMIVKVPVGTIVRDDDTGEIIADITEQGQRVIVARGGRGGRGNIHFANASNKAPEIAEKGEPGQEHWLRLELKLIADVGLVGMPNAGKSTIISKISDAKPKIADYPFTTIVPNLGVVQLEPGVSFVVADVPGLIKGAHTGLGLGHRFLRHVERTRVILHVLDMSGTNEKTPWDDFDTINNELKLYRQDLAERLQIVVANKMDMPNAEENLVELEKHLQGKYEIFPVSALNGEGLKKLMYHTYELLKNAPVPAPVLGAMKIVKVEAKEEFTVNKSEDGAWLITGDKIEKLILMTNWESDESTRRMQHIMNKMGIDDALRNAGAKDGDLVRIADTEFDFAD